jgi:hypothetical protein
MIVLLRIVRSDILRIDRPSIRIIIDHSVCIIEYRLLPELRELSSYVECFFTRTLGNVVLRLPHQGAVRTILDILSSWSSGCIHPLNRISTHNRHHDLLSYPEFFFLHSRVKLSDILYRHSCNWSSNTSKCISWSNNIYSSSDLLRRSGTGSPWTAIKWSIWFEIELPLGVEGFEEEEWGFFIQSCWNSILRRIYILKLKRSTKRKYMRKWRWISIENKRRRYNIPLEGSIKNVSIITRSYCLIHICTTIYVSTKVSGDKDISNWILPENTLKWLALEYW